MNYLTNVATFIQSFFSPYFSSESTANVGEGGVHQAVEEVAEQRGNGADIEIFQHYNNFQQLLADPHIRMEDGIRVETEAPALVDQYYPSVQMLLNDNRIDMNGTIYVENPARAD
jgi:hypothetical protein